MRRKDREITDINEIKFLLKTTDTIRIGFNDQPYPYIVPVSYGFEEKNNQIIIYFHGAREGKKTELIEENNRVCIETDITNDYLETLNSVTCLYESIIGYGEVFKIENHEAKHGLDLILTHCGYRGYEYSDKCLENTAVYKIVIKEITGKKNIDNIIQWKKNVYFKFFF